jgi:hypothetical protein
MEERDRSIQEMGKEDKDFSIGATEPALNTISKGF